MVHACISVEMDGPSFWADGLGMRNLMDLSRGEYERVAVPRVLDLLAEYDAKATWFVPGVTAIAFPELVEAIVAAGHEVAHHGWRHEWQHDTVDEQRRSFEQGIEALTERAGIRPKGYRAPGSGLTNEAVDLLVELGFEWDSSLAGDDFAPYYLRAGAGVRADGTYEWGNDTSVVEIPLSWNMDDCPAFEFIWNQNAGLRTAADVLESWSAELDYVLEHCPDGMFATCFHSQVIGRGNRLPMMRGLLDRMAAADLRFVTFSELAADWKLQQVA